MTTPPATCVKLIPDEWSQGVKAAPVPDNAAVTLGTPLTAALAVQIAGPWGGAYVQMSAQVEKANGRTADTIEIMRRCEAMINEARADRR